MSVIVRAHDPNGAVGLIEEALGSAPGAAHEGAYVCVGDTIDTEEVRLQQSMYPAWRPCIRAWQALAAHAAAQAKLSLFYRKGS